MPSAEETHPSKASLSGCLRGFHHGGDSHTIPHTRGQGISKKPIHAPYCIALYIYRRKLYGKPAKNNVSSFYAVKLKKVKKELEEVKIIRQGLYKDYKLNMISSSEYTDMKAGFEEQYNDLLKQIASLSKSIELEKTKKLPINETFEYLKARGTPKELTRDMVIKLVDRIIIGNNNEIKIIYNFEDIFKDYAKEVATLQNE